MLLTLGVLLFFGFQFLLSSFPFTPKTDASAIAALALLERQTGASEAIRAFVMENYGIARTLLTILFSTTLIVAVAGNGRRSLSRGASWLAVACSLLLALVILLFDARQPNTGFYCLFLLLVIGVSKDDKRLQAAQVAFAITYVLCTSLKLSPGWSTGSLFLAVGDSLPGLDPTWVPLATKILAVFQGIAGVLLLSRNGVAKTAACLCLIGFHWYSSLIAGTTFGFMMPVLLTTLYLGLCTEKGKQTRQGRLESWLEVAQIGRAPAFVILLMSVLQLSTAHLGGSRYLTFNMFKESVACVVTTTTNGQSTQEGRPATTASCEPEQVVLEKRRLCTSASDHVFVSIWSSTDARPYRVTVPPTEICAIDEIPLVGRPSWILNEDQASLVGRYSPTDIGVLNRRKITRPIKIEGDSLKMISSTGLTVSENSTGYAAFQSHKLATGEFWEESNLDKLFRIVLTLLWHLEFATALILIGWRNFHKKAVGGCPTEFNTD